MEGGSSDSSLILWLYSISNFIFLCSKLIIIHHGQNSPIIFKPRIERFSYDLEMKTREQNKGTEIERFDWFIERIQTRLAFGWLSERSGEKTSCPRTF